MVDKRAKKFGQGPPPPFGQCRKNFFFLYEVFPKNINHRFYISSLGPHTKTMEIQFMFCQRLLYWNSWTQCLCLVSSSFEEEVI